MLLAIEVLILAPVLVAVVCGALLLFGVSPRLVFLPGHLAKVMLTDLGVDFPNRLGVVVTGVVWWAVLVAVRLAAARLNRHPDEGTE